MSIALRYAALTKDLTSFVMWFGPGVATGRLLAGDKSNQPQERSKTTQLIHIELRWWRYWPFDVVE